MYGRDSLFSCSGVLNLPDAAIKNAPSLYITVLVRAMRGNEKTGGRIDWHGAASSFEVKR